jgi:hypothetical protein
MEVSTFLTGVSQAANGSQNRQIGQVTGKPIDEIFPNADEITQTFDRLEDMIDVRTFYLNDSFIENGKQDLRQDNQPRERLLPRFSKQDVCYYERNEGTQRACHFSSS